MSEVELRPELGERTREEVPATAYLLQGERGGEERVAAEVERGRERGEEDGAEGEDVRDGGSVAAEPEDLAQELDREEVDEGLLVLNVLIVDRRRLRIVLDSRIGRCSNRLMNYRKIMGKGTALDTISRKAAVFQAVNGRRARRMAAHGFGSMRGLLQD